MGVEDEGEETEGGREGKIAGERDGDTDRAGKEEKRLSQG
jgi:hypothetical protein